MYDALTGTLSAATKLHDYTSGRSSMAVSNDGSIAVIQERDDTFGHNKIAAYRCAQCIQRRFTTCSLLQLLHRIP